MKDNWLASLIKESYTDRQIMILTYDRLKDSLSGEKLIEEIARSFLPIGFDLDYWKGKVRDVLESEGLIPKEVKEKEKV